MKIKVYITESREGRVHISTRDYEKVTPHGSMSCQDGILLDDPTYIEENCKNAIEVVIDFAEKNGIRYKIYNVANSWPAFCAWIEGVKTFPTVTIGRKKIEGVPIIGDLEKILNY
jgi:hypothetical protein